MIFELLINTLVSSITFIFGALPALPSTPVELQSAADTLISFMGSGIYLLRYIFSTILLNIVLGVIAAVFVFERFYASIMFVVKKLPFINIK